MRQTLGWPRVTATGMGHPGNVCSVNMTVVSSRAAGPRAANMFPWSSKDQVRRAVWRAMDRKGSHGFRAPRAGAKLRRREAGRREARRHRLWKRAQVIKANPDSPQTHARRLALEEGKSS